MMKLDYLLGLLGLLGIAVLLLIYLLKPNYQQKVVSSTYVWKLSLKYRKKQLPINKFRNILILICQILIITISAFILAQPYLSATVEPPTNETIIIIDASASMLGRQGANATRFERAVSQAKELGEQKLGNNERISIIVADQEVETSLWRGYDISSFRTELDKLVAINQTTLLPSGCTYGSADVNGAMRLAEDYMTDNPSAKVVFYTATQYENSNENIEVISVAVTKTEGDKEKEWNAAIVDCTATFSEGYYRFDIKVASYNDNRDFNVYFMPYGANDSDPESRPTMAHWVNAECRNNDILTVKFYDLKIYSFNRIHVYIDEDDSFGYDNNFYIYGSEKEKLSIVYVTPMPSDFYTIILPAMFTSLKNKWKISFEITSLTQLVLDGKELKGYDFYILEYEMPEVIPDDGMVWIVCYPDYASRYSMLFEEELGLNVNGKVDKRTVDPELRRLYPGVSSQLTNWMDPTALTVSQYVKFTSVGDFMPLMYFRDEFTEDPVILAKNTNGQKIVISAFASLFSDLTMTAEYSMLIYNMLNCMVPPTLSSFAFEIDQQLKLNQSDAVLNETNPVFNIARDGASGKTEIFDTYPYAISVSVPGTYILTQKFFDRTFSEKYFVRIAATESDFTRILAFTDPSVPEKEYDDYDLFIYFIAALIALLFIERLLHIKEDF